MLVMTIIPSQEAQAQRTAQLEATLGALSSAAIRLQQGQEQLQRDVATVLKVTMLEAALRTSDAQSDPALESGSAELHEALQESLAVARRL